MQKSDVQRSDDYIRTLAKSFIDDEAREANDDELEKELRDEGDSEPDQRFTSSTRVYKTKGRPSSAVWKYFKKQDNTKDSTAVCLLCERDGINVEIKRPGSSTRDMWKHLSTFHNIDKYGNMVQGGSAEGAPPYQP